MKNSNTTISSLYKEKKGTNNYAELIGQIKDFCNKGINHYDNDNLKLAEQEFVKALKLTLTKSTIKALYSETIHASINDIKSETLTAMYYLGLIYLKDHDYFDNYSKAAAIFQYCNGFAEKYNIKQFEMNKKQIDFLKEAHLAEKKFLLSINKNNHFTDDEYYILSIGKIKENKKALKTIRNEVEDKLAQIENLLIENISERAEKVEKIYDDSVRFFVDHKDNQGFIQKLINECKEQLGQPPEGCEYTFIGLGSLAMGTITPWSDLEFGILINEDKEEYKEYFRNLTKLLHVKVINFGETPLRSSGVESLNNFRTANAEDEWFWDDVLASGFSFDGPDWHACKTPLGRWGYKVKQKSKNENGIQEERIIDKPNYELILTPHQLADFQKVHNNDLHSEHLVSDWFDSDKHLVQALRTVSLIDGDQKLLDDYRNMIKKNDQQQLIENHNQFLTETNDQDQKTEKLIQEFKTYLLKEKPKKLFDDYNKSEVIESKNDDTNNYIFNKKLIEKYVNHVVNTTVIELLKTLDSENVDPVKVKETFIEIKERVIQIAKKVYASSEYDALISDIFSRVERILFNNESKANNNLMQTKILGLLFEDLSKFKIDLSENTEGRFLNVKSDIYRLADRILCALADYYEINEEISVWKKIDKMGEREFLSKDGVEHLKQALSIATELRMKTYAHNSSQNEIMSAYKPTSKIVDETQNIQSENFYFKDIKIINHFFFIMLRMQNISKALSSNTFNHYAKFLLTSDSIYEDSAHTKALVYKRFLNYQEALEIIKDEGHSVNLKLRSDIINLYLKLSKYDEAIQCGEEILYYLKSLMPQDISDYENDIGTMLNNLAVIHARSGNNKEAIILSNETLDIYSRFKSTIQSNVANTHSNLGGFLITEGEYEEAKEHIDIAYEIYRKIYSENLNCSDISVIFNSLSLYYLGIGNFTEAIEYHNKAHAIKLKIYGDHEDVILSYSNGGYLYMKLPNDNLAIDNFNKALEMYENIYGSDHHGSLLVLIYSGLGNVYLKIGDNKKALENFNNALKTAQIIYEINPFHVNIAKICMSLGKIYNIERCYKEAIKNSMIAANIFYRLYDETNVANKTTMVNLYQSITGVDTDNKQELDSIFNEISKEIVDNNEFGYFNILDNVYHPLDSIYSMCLGITVKKCRDLAYLKSDTFLAINCQKVLLKLDPNLTQGNHYHNLACYLACDGNIEEANKEFINALNHPNTKLNGDLYVEYAQFLIMNRDSTALFNNIQNISEYLYKTINSEKAGNLSYSNIELNSVCNILKSLIEQESTATITINSKTLAYYLLIKNPEYINTTGGDNIISLLEDFSDYCLTLNSKVSYLLLQDIVNDSNNIANDNTSEKNNDNMENDISNLSGEDSNFEKDADNCIHSSL